MLFQFYDLLISNPVPYFTLKNRQVTIFAPTNEAFQRYSGTLDESLVLYHMSKSRYNMFITISSHSVQLHYNLAYAFRLICNIAVNYYLGWQKYSKIYLILPLIYS